MYKVECVCVEPATGGQKCSLRRSWRYLHANDLDDDDDEKAWRQFPHQQHHQSELAEAISKLERQLLNQ